MSSPVNIQRDGHWITIENSKLLTWPTALTIASGTINMNSDGVVYDVFSSARPDFRSAPTVPVDSWESVGTWMRPPDVDVSPYRVKAKAISESTTLLVVGYGPASITGTNDLMSDIFVMPVVGEIDTMLMIPNLLDSDPNYERAIGFGLAITAAPSSAGLVGALSVQRLASTPPQLAQSTS